MRTLFIFLLFFLTHIAQAQDAAQDDAAQYRYTEAALERYGTLETLMSDNSTEALYNRMDTLHSIPQHIIDSLMSLQIQDFDGRLKPLDTFAIEIMRKIAHTTNLQGIKPPHFLVALMVFPFDMMRLKIIYVDNKEVLALLGIQPNEGKYIALKDVLDMGKLQQGESFEHAYKIYNFVQDAMRKPPAKQNSFDKSILKLHEKISYVQAKNIWSYLRIFPYRDSSEWFSPTSEAITAVLDAYSSWYLGEHSSSDSAMLDLELDNMKVSPSYAIRVNAIASFVEKELLVGLLKNDWSGFESVGRALHEMQQIEAKGRLLGDTLVQTERALNRFDMFLYLQYAYLIVGILALCVILYAIITLKTLPKYSRKLFFITLCLLFSLHTAALLVRWYVAGHAPWSNAYESMIYIAWASILAAIVLRHSFLMLGAAGFLAGVILMVAHLSAMDPQISNLVPVLQSYWLNIHVSVIVASYGFFGLSMILGVLALILFILRNAAKPQLDTTILALTILNERSMIIGIVALTIGTFLGGIWANESWGRYWGWDAKETWSLVTICVYACILHIRLFIHKNMPYIFNVCAVLGFYSVLMTYFGVNYYLTGMHSYASGDGESLKGSDFVPHAFVFGLIAWAWLKRNLEFR